MRKLGEEIKLNSFVHERFNAPTVRWNGASVTTAAGTGWDTRDYKGASIELRIGTILGESATLSAALYESDVDNPTLSIPITGGSFTDRNSANDVTTEEGAVDLQQRRRYMWLRTEVKDALSVPTVDYSGGAIFGVPDSEAVSKTLKFDL